MRIKTKNTAYVVLGSVILGSVALGAHSVLVQGRGLPGETSGVAHASENKSEKKLNRNAEVLNITSDELKDQLEDSTFEEVVLNNGFDTIEDFEAALEQHIREHLAARGLTDEEIDERLARKALKREMKEDIRAVREELLGLTRDEIKELKKDGQSFEEILEAAGFDSIEAFQEALKKSVTEIWVAEEIDQETIDARLEKLDKKFERKAEKRANKHNSDNGSSQDPDDGTGEETNDDTSGDTGDGSTGDPSA